MDYSSTNGKLDTDRYGVPHPGDPEHFEDYVERCWGLYYGRDGQDALQTSSPLHLGAQLSGPACEAVRGLDQKVEDKMMEMGDRCLEECSFSWTLSNPAPASPGKHKFESTNFLGILLLTDCVARTTETMAQHIIRHETELKRLQEVSPETTLSDNLRCMLLMIFSGLDAKEQQSGVLASVNSEYNYKKVTHALKMQFPNLIQRLVVRRDYLGAARGGGGLQHGSKGSWKGHRRAKQVLSAVVNDEQETYEAEDDQAFQNEADDLWRWQWLWVWRRLCLCELLWWWRHPVDAERAAFRSAREWECCRGLRHDRPTSPRFQEEYFWKKAFWKHCAVVTNSVPCQASGDINIDLDQRAKNGHGSMHCLLAEGPLGWGPWVPSR